MPAPWCITIAKYGGRYDIKLGESITLKAKLSRAYKDSSVENPYTSLTDFT